ncbi:metal ABC transporter solute-binding protein, Zn/Mn family [Bacillus kwashiorkori]|uniref:metal ABC transporter solute-binding protein, Zn/Mn family n=1 Tax=Bacillus kwashiorkori TaxID=1522318 RepID=UPI0007846805|nr:zinc ABC transporter substrate-binding protein [Bacillus kwashiorkori]
MNFQLRRFLLTIVIFVGFFLTACNSEKSDVKSSETEKITIVTTISQIGEPLSVIGGNRVEVKSLMGPSVDPHLYNATHGDIQKIENADIVFFNGLNLEANMVNIFNEIGKTKPVLAIGETIDKQKLLQDEDGAVDPHIWFDIDLWKEALTAAVEELKKYSPDDANQFEKNKEDYFVKLDELKKEAEKIAEIPESQRVLVTAHDAFGYFGRMYNMKVVGLQGLSTDGEIGVSDIQHTINLILEYRVPAVFVESSVNQNAIKAVVEGAKKAGIDVRLGGELFSDAMGEKGTKEGTYIGMYQHNINTVYEALMRGDE